MIDVSSGAHRRYDALNRKWVLVSPHRTQRPWNGQEEPQPHGNRLPYDPKCYLCPGNVRASGERNPAYSQTHVFANDFPALTYDPQNGVTAPHPLLAVQTARGICRVMCFSPRHDLSLGDIDIAGLLQVIDLWTEQYERHHSRRGRKEAPAGNRAPLSTRWEVRCRK